MITARWAPYRLNFKFEARTSRQSMRVKDTWLIQLTDDATGRTAWGECALFAGLSADDFPDYEERLRRALAAPETPAPESSIRFGIETAMRRLRGTDGPDTPFARGSEGLPINGLIWMGNRELMRKRIDRKLAQGFKVLKLKIGGIDFADELELLRYVRQAYSPADLTLRLDANGSFSPADALERIKRLSDFGIHSIEQPVRAGQPDVMARLCEQSPIDIALDEELIGTPDADSARQLLDTIRPAYIILKPALCGGLSGADLWADTAESIGIGWWATSALESNIGLDAIARWVAARRHDLPQGLGTGQLYTNNIPSPLRLRGERLYTDPAGTWTYPELQWRQ